MFLPDKILINLKNLNAISNSLISYFNIILHFNKCADFTDIGNDIEYSKKQISSFKKNLFNLIKTESKKYESDILGNYLKNITKYQYAELIFSEDYLNIVSIRLFGKNKDNTFNRYVLFNIKNSFDPSTINILHNFKDILKNYIKKEKNIKKNTEFINKYLKPSPFLHPINQVSFNCINNVSKKFDDGKEKDYSKLLEQNNVFNSKEFKEKIYNSRNSSFTKTDSLFNLLSKADDILDKINEIEINDCSKELVDFVFKDFFFKYNMPDIFKEISLSTPEIPEIKIPDFDLSDLNVPNFQIPNIKIPKFKIPNFNININDLFGDYSFTVDCCLLKIISITLSEITKNILELLKKLNKIDDFAMENIFPLPEIDKKNNKSKFESSFNEEWLIYIEYVYRLLIETDKQKTQSKPINLPQNMLNNIILNKIKNKQKNITEDFCEKPEDSTTNKLNKKMLKKSNTTIQEDIQNSDIDSLIEKIKYYNFYKENEKTEEILRLISSFKDKENTQEPKPSLPMSSSEIIKSTSDMIEQIESILEPKEINTLLNGTYSEETAEIVRAIAKINFPVLTYRVDPIKYFRMLGKVIGSKNKPDVLNIKESLRNLGIKK